MSLIKRNSILAMGVGALLGAIYYFSPSSMASDSDTDKNEQVAKFMAALDVREKAMKQKEEKLQNKERELADKEALIVDQVKRTEQTLVDLRAKIQLLEAQAEERTKSFSQVYEKMEPKRAAKILEDLNLDIASTLLNGMKKDKAAEILSKMSASKARFITEKMVIRKPATQNP